MLEAFVRQVSFQYKDTDYALSTLVADKETDLLAFFNSEKPLTADIFYTVAFQLLGFSFFVDFDDSEAFRKETAFPITYGSLLGKSLPTLKHPHQTRQYLDRSVGQRWFDSWDQPVSLF